jgi:uncharacterized repeat protein (TIGR04138 family)
MPELPAQPQKTLDHIADEVGLYPVEAYQFVGAGLKYTVDKLKGKLKDPKASRHITGQELSEGLREFALLQWGRLTRLVLTRWNIHRTDDFGKIVFALVDNGWLAKTDQDSPDDFRSVYDFSAAFDAEYRIECPV